MNARNLCIFNSDGVFGNDSLPMSELAEREGFEPSVQVLARTTV